MFRLYNVMLQLQQKQTGASAGTFLGPESGHYTGHASFKGPGRLSSEHMRQPLKLEDRMTF